MPNTFAAGAFRSKTFAPHTLAGGAIVVVTAASAPGAAGRRRAAIRLLLIAEMNRALAEQATQQQLSKVRTELAREVHRVELQRMMEAATAKMQIEAAMYSILLAEV